MKRVCFTGLLVALSIAPAFARERPTPIRSAVRAAFAAGDALPIQSSSENRPRGDSVRNGAVIGAVIGGVGAALFGAYLCNAVGEEGDPPCWRGVLAFGAIGAGIGAASGATIDALHARGSPADDGSSAGMPLGSARVGITLRQRF